MVLFEGGANLDAPADPSSADYPARPEWYYLSLFQMLKYFPGSREVIGTIVIPSALLARPAPPAVPRSGPPAASSPISWPAASSSRVVGGAGLPDGPGASGMMPATHCSRRLARRPTPPGSGRSAGRLAGCRHPAGRRGLHPPSRPADPGQAVLERRCLGCHVDGGTGAGDQSAPDLAGFGSRAWIRGLAGESAVAGVLRQGPPVRRHGRMEEELEAEGEGARRRRRLRRLVRHDPRGHDPGRVAAIARRRQAPGLRAVPEGMRDLSHR